MDNGQSIVSSLNLHSIKDSYVLKTLCNSKYIRYKADTKIVKTNFSVERYQYRYLLKELSVKFWVFQDELLLWKSKSLKGYL